MRPSSALTVLILVAAVFRRCSSSESVSDEQADDDGRESVKLIYGETHGISWTDLTDEDRKTPILTSPNMKIYSVDYHYKRNLFFFMGDGAIWRKVWGDGELEYKIVDQSAEAATLTVDWVHDRIYWTDPINSSLWRCDFEGERRDLLFTSVDQLTFLNSLAVDPYMMYLFLATKAGYTLRTDLEGNGLVKLNTRLKHPSIALDTHNRRLYIAGLQDFNPAIQSFDYDGGNVINYNPRNDSVAWRLPRSIAVFSGLEGEPTLLFSVYHDTPTAWGVLDTVWKTNVTEDQLSCNIEYVVQPGHETSIWCVKVYHSEVQARPRYWDTEHREWPKETDPARLGSTPTNNVTASNNNNVTASNNNTNNATASSDSKTCSTFVYIILSLALSSVL